MIEENKPLEEEKKINIARYVIVSLTALFLITIIGLIIWWVNEYNYSYFEITYALCGVLILLICMGRIRIRDRNNLKKTKSVHEDHKSKEYREWFASQLFLAGTGIVSALLSLIPFFIANH